VHISSDRTYDLPAPAPEVWAAIAAVEDFPRWWPWLRAFDGTALAAGQVWSCVVQPPLPYSLAFRVHLDEVEPGRSARARVEGDLHGQALLEVVPGEPGCAVRLRSTLAPRRAVLRTVAGLAPPVARFGHDWVLDTGLRQFQERLGQP
jgi:hypothetical protein